jgi:hypothetical protein
MINRYENISVGIYWDDVCILGWKLSGWSYTIFMRISKTVMCKPASEACLLWAKKSVMQPLFGGTYLRETQKSIYALMWSNIIRVKSVLRAYVCNHCCRIARCYRLCTISSPAVQWWNTTCDCDYNTHYCALYDFGVWWIYHAYNEGGALYYIRYVCEVQF